MPAEQAAKAYKGLKISRAFYFQHCSHHKDQGEFGPTSR